MSHAGGTQVIDITTPALLRLGRRLHLVPPQMIHRSSRANFHLMEQRSGDEFGAPFSLLELVGLDKVRVLPGQLPVAELTRVCNG